MELSYELKYKAALDKAKKYYRSLINLDGTVACMTKDFFEETFPELAGNYDEQIRKDLIEFLGDLLQHGINATFDKWDKADCSDWLNWLEKREKESHTESIYETLEKVKTRERKELIEKLRLHGKRVDDGYEWHFKGKCPIVAAYDYDEPCDVVILSVMMDKKDNLIIIGDEKNDRGHEHEILVKDIFAGHLEFITNKIC